MKVVVFWVAAVAATLPVMAQPALVEGCKALADAERRAACFEELLQQRQATQPTDPLDAMRREGQAVMSSTDVGISLVQYQAALQRLATEIDLAKGKAVTDTAKSEVAAYESALEAFSDAAKFWAAWISFYARRDNGVSYGGGLPLRMTNMEWVASKYGLSTVAADLLGFHRGLPKSTVQELWRVAKGRIEQTKKGAEAPVK